MTGYKIKNECLDLLSEFEFKLLLYEKQKACGESKPKSDVKNVWPSPNP